MKMLSLFDGIGGFPLAGSFFGIEPVAASEVEPFCIRVTQERFPGMKHLGSVTDINGAETEPVDIVTFGSPCQDLSVAGKQLGIHDGERSNLFFEAVRIIKEMREHDRAVNGRTGVDVRPRFAVWENVPGAFSSNKGEDFKSVLEALCSVCDEAVSVPRPAGGAGLLQDASWVKATRLPGVSLTLNTTEFPSDARESTLSQILDLNAPEKYSLSVKACLGILRRAEKRGKVLPDMLKEALMEVVSRDEQQD